METDFNELVYILLLFGLGCGVVILLVLVMMFYHTWKR